MKQWTVLFLIGVACLVISPAFIDVSNRSRQTYIARKHIVTASSARPAGAQPRFRRVEITGDGACLFRAIAQGAHMASKGSPMSVSAEGVAAYNLRLAVVKELRNRKSELLDFMPGIADDWEGYLANMSDPSAWGGEPEMVMASNILKRPISVYRIVARRAELVVTYGEGLPVKEITLLWQGAHYDLLVDEDDSR